MLVLKQLIKKLPYNLLIGYCPAYFWKTAKQIICRLAAIYIICEQVIVLRNFYQITSTLSSYNTWLCTNNYSTFSCAIHFIKEQNKAYSQGKIYEQCKSEHNIKFKMRTWYIYIYNKKTMTTTTKKSLTLKWIFVVAMNFRYAEGRKDSAHTQTQTNQNTYSKMMHHTRHQSIYIVFVPIKYW